MSLINVLIGLLLSTLVMTEVIQWVEIAKKGFYHQQQIFSSLSNGYTSLQYLMRDIQASGYRGCRTRDLSFPIRHNYSEYNAISTFLKFNQPLFSFLASRAGCYGNMPESACRRIKENTQVLILYNVPQKINKIMAAMEHPNDIIQTEHSHGIQKNALVLISDCHQGDLFIANRVEATKIFHDQLLGINKNDTFSKAYSKNAEMVELQTVAYYIGTPERYQKINYENRSTARYALFRDDFMQPAQEIVPDVSDIQFEFGLINGETTHFHYKKIIDMKEQEWSLVQSIRVYLITQDKKSWEYEISLRNRLYSYLPYYVAWSHFFSFSAYDDTKFIYF